MNMTFEIDTPEFDAAINKLSNMPYMLEDTMKKFKGKLSKKISENDFSILEHICHLRDLENEGYLARINKMLVESQPNLTDFAGGKIALEREYNKQNAAFALEDFKSCREQSVKLFKSLTSEQLKRSGELEGVGTITLENLICLMLQHDESHLKELDELTTQL